MCIVLTGSVSFEISRNISTLNNVVVLSSKPMTPSDLCIPVLFNDATSLKTHHWKSARKMVV